MRRCSCSSDDFACWQVRILQSDSPDAKSDDNCKPNFRIVRASTSPPRTLDLTSSGQQIADPARAKRHGTACREPPSPGPEHLASGMLGSCKTAKVGHGWQPAAEMAGCLPLQDGAACLALQEPRHMQVHNFVLAMPQQAGSTQACTCIASHYWDLFLGSRQAAHPCSHVASILQQCNAHKEMLEVEV